MSKSLAFFAALYVCLSVVSAGAQDIPPEKELKALTRDSLLAFNEAVQAKDFTRFNQQAASTWQEQVPPAKAKTIFQTFIDEGIDLGQVGELEPSFNVPPAINSDGWLVLKGSYPTVPNKILFELKYLQEAEAWKLAGINVNVEPSGGGTGKVPSSDEAVALVRRSLSAFAEAVETKDFGDFHAGIASAWQKQVTPEGLLESFTPFVEQNNDLTRLATMTPTFDAPPALDENEFLVLKGSYPSESDKILFDLAYIYEDAAWKLAKIIVQVQPLDDASR